MCGNSGQEVNKCHKTSKLKQKERRTIYIQWWVKRNWIKKYQEEQQTKVEETRYERWMKESFRKTNGALNFTLYNNKHI